jgi:hypothetical protein
MTRRTVRSIAAFGFAAISLAGLSACGERMVTYEASGNNLSGTITFNGEKVTYASVFVVQEGHQTSGSVMEEGKYLVVNCHVGPATICVNSDSARGRFMSDSMAAGAYAGPEAKGKDAGKKKTNVKFIEIPKKYQDDKTSGIKTTIEKGDNTFDIAISTKGEK